ncbi:MAG: class I SAM-dependent methyltransferase [Acidobacteria bacterium]|nr:class I SAM-dependent methyltransferase [Acidobacteriota bacterium]
MHRSESGVGRSESLRNLYDAGYFHGANSGYPKEGYALHHPDWGPWLKRIGALIPAGSRWLDLGCAYGFLVEQARQKGYGAIGCDISHYALAQNSRLREFLAEADALTLPFQSDCLDMITAFDLLEHLDNPAQALREIHRCLAPDGVLVATTPDPCRFTGKEPTHIHERPPSYWVALFQKNGFFCNFGFEGADFNLVLAASKSQDRVENFHELLFESDLLEVTRPSDVSISGRVRTGFHASADGWILGEQNELYLFNASDFPVAASLEFSAKTTGHNGALLFIADGRVLKRIEFLSGRREFTCKQENILLPSGGHSLRLELGDGKSAGQIAIGPIRLKGAAASNEALTSRLPFDLFERYHAAALLYQRLSQRPQSVLDIGGYIGDQGGHWADASNFGLPAVFSDIRPADSPRYLSQAALRGEQFDLVLSLDVLEHVPSHRRKQFLDEIDRLNSQYLLIAGPFACPETETAEQAVREWLLEAGVSNHGFLSEHSEHGLPTREDLLQWISVKGYFFLEFEGMSTHMWEILQKISLFLAHYQQYHTLEQLNRSVNKEALWTSNGKPYRHFFLISKYREVEESVQLLPRAQEPLELLFFLEHAPEILSHQTIQRQTDTLFLLNENQKHIRLLENQVRLLEEEAQLLKNQVPLLQNRTRLMGNQTRLLENHIHTLEKLVHVERAEREKPLAQIAWQRLRNRMRRKNE